MIGKNGETIKALQQFTGAQIQIDQRCDPTRVSIAGPAKAMQMATSMVQVGVLAAPFFCPCWVTALRITDAAGCGR